MATKKRNKKITYSEFLAWISGVEEMQDENWHPDADQWKTIRNKLDLVKPDEIEVIVDQPTTPVHPAFIPVSSPPVVPASSLEAPPIKRPSMQTSLPSAMQTAGASASDLGSVKTPTIDTSTAPYETDLV